MVEVLRHTGIRIEELTELSHHSLIQYRLPATGELIPLLQIAPSKTDTERLLVICPELADVLSADRRPDPRRPARRAAGGRPTTRTNASTTRPCRCCSNGAADCENRAVSETALRNYLDHALTAHRRQRRRRAPAALHLPRLPQAVHHRRDHARHAAAHRPTRRRPPRHQHHHGLQGRLPRRGDQRPPRVHRPPPRAAPQRGIPHPDRRGMGRVPRPLRTPQGRRRRLRPLLRHPLHPRTQLPALPAAAPRPRRHGPASSRSATTSSPASPKPNPTAGSAKPRASRSASPAPTPSSPRWTRSPPAATTAVQLGIPSLHRRRRPHHHQPDHPAQHPKPVMTSQKRHRHPVKIIFLVRRRRARRRRSGRPAPDGPTNTEEPSGAALSVRPLRTFCSVPWMTSFAGLRL